jgi:hypothetical protein
VDSYNELVNLAITQEDCIMAHRAKKRKKTPSGPSSAPPLRYRLVQNTSPQVPRGHHRKDDGLPGHRSSRLPSITRLSSRLVPGQMLHHPLVQNRRTIASTAGILLTLPASAPKPGHQNKARVRASETRARARGKL